METLRIAIAICMVGMLFVIPILAIKSILDSSKD